MLSFLLKGILLGISIAAPVGPIGILCINNTLRKGQTSGLFTGLGAATADFLYGLTAALGLTTLSGFLLAQRLWIQLAGLLFLLVTGVRLLFHRSGWQGGPAPGRPGLWRDYTTTFLLTITNPMTILSFLALFAAMGLPGAVGNRRDALALAGGVFFGSVAWWITLSSGTHLVRKRVTPRLSRMIDVGSAILLIGFGAYLMMDLFHLI